MASVRIGNKQVGGGHPCFIVAEIGLNHNGSLDIAKQLIDIAVDAGCDAVKFQKRTPELCVPPEQRNVMRETPWGQMTYMEYRYRVEFGKDEYDQIDFYCKVKNILWFASCWDEESIDFMERFAPPCYKIPSAALTDRQLLEHFRHQGRPIILSTGMSAMEQVKRAVEILGSEDLIVLHCTSTYPAADEELNLNVIKTFQKEYPHIPIGYSGHEVRVAPSVMAAVLGACMIERHITLDRTMWGSDQAASLEPKGIGLVVRDIRVWERARGDGVKRVWPSEAPLIKRLRRKQDF